MAGPSTARQLLRFGNFEVDVAARELRRNGISIKLQEQPFRLLVALVERPDEVVTRDELRDRLWAADTFVDFETGLNAAIKKLRRALRDDPASPRFIETVPKRGYRFLANVQRSISTAACEGAAVEISGGLRETLAQPTNPRRGRHLWLTLSVPIALALAAASIFWLAERRENAVPTERRLTANPADAPIRAAAISPDGKYLAYTDTTGLYVKQVETGEMRRLNLPQGIAQVLPDSWFPDGTDFVATGFLHSPTRVSLWRFSVLGSNPQQIIDDAFGAAVSHDGRRIAFLRGGPDYNRFGHEVWITTPSTGDSSRISELPDSKDASWGKYFASLSWSPTGDQLAYVKIDPGPQQRIISILTQPARRARPRLLMSGVEPTVCWTSDGRIVYPKRDSANAEPALWAMQVDSQGGTKAREPERIFASGEFVKMSATSDARRIMLLRDEARFQIFLSEWVPTRNQWSPLRRLSFDQHRTQPWAWTPDSKSIILTSDRNGPSEVFKQSIDEPNPELLASNEHEVKVARIMPSGADVLFNQLFPDSKGTVGLFRVPLSGGQPQRLLSGSGINNFQCARLPSRLCVFDESRSGAGALIAYDSLTGARRDIGALPDDPYGTDWNLSPDGSSIAILLGERIRFVSVASGTTLDVVVHGWTDLHAIDWAPDSKNVLVASGAPGGPTTLLQIDLRGNAHPLIQTPANMPMIWSVPSPDGKYQAVMTVVGSNNAWMLQNY